MGSGDVFFMVFDGVRGNSKRSRRFFWVEKEQLCWGRARTDAEIQNVKLRDCLGIVYGPMTTCFQRCESREDPDWACFSLLFTGRTLDLAVPGDLQIHAWLLGLQHLVSQWRVGSMPMMSEAEFYRRKVQFKLQATAHQQGLVLSRFLINKAPGTRSTLYIIIYIHIQHNHIINHIIIYTYEVEVI